MHNTFYRWLGVALAMGLLVAACRDTLGDTCRIHSDCAPAYFCGPEKLCEQQCVRDYDCAEGLSCTELGQCCPPGTRPACPGLNPPPEETDGGVNDGAADGAVPDSGS